MHKATTKWWTKGRTEGAIGLALVAPSGLFFAALIVYPIFRTICLSFYNVSSLTFEGRYVGLNNYREVLHSPEFATTVANTFVWTLCTLVLQLVIGVAMALALHRKFFLSSLARGIVLFPYLLTTAVAVLIWQWLFNDLYGYLNYVLIAVGLISQPISWLGQMPNAMAAVIFVGTWKSFPFVVIAVLAKLQTIPQNLYESAKIDGASRFSLFWDITFPQLKSVLYMVILLRSIWDFKEFDLIYLLTGGGPQIGTQTLPVLIYKQAFQLLKMGAAASTAVIMLCILMLFYIAYFIASSAQERRER